MKALTHRQQEHVSLLFIATAVILGILVHRVFLAIAFLFAIAVVGQTIADALERYSHRRSHGHRPSH